MTIDEIKENIANNGPAVYYNIHKDKISIRTYLFDISNNYIWSQLYKSNEDIPYQPMSIQFKDLITKEPLYQIKEK